MFRLEGKSAIVTGAAHGIGRAIADALAAAGAWVLLVDLDEEAGRAAAHASAARGLAVDFAKCDVSQPAMVHDAVEHAIRIRSRIDILVNNAAHLVFNDLLETPPAQWDQSLSVSLGGAANFTREVLPHMIRAKGGAIINVSSVQGLVGGRTSAAYTAAKTGLIGLTRSVAYDYGQHNIRVNAICPGPIRTRVSPPEGSELHQRQISKTMLGRTGQPKEVAAAAVFLASDEAAYVTGAVLPVDGGWTAM
jgi:NAD(P)-dependent dehydrogenase (short-subunit alcohol dehydrogenase family)